MSAITRSDPSVFGQWWWTVDRWLLSALLALILTGTLMVFAASPGVADRIALDGYHFVKRQLLWLPLALAILLATSLLAPWQIRRLSAFGYVLCIALLVATLAVGAETKGSQRWLSFAGFSLQASEFTKPFVAVVSAWMFAEWQRTGGRLFLALAVTGLALVVGLVIVQPDLGMTAVIVVVWLAQFFLAGMPLRFVALSVPLIAGGLFAAYSFLPHVAKRVDLFLDPSLGDNYQVDQSLAAFAHGGLFGTGPGEGTVKAQLPDAHADFVFAVLGEEFGALAGLGIVALFGFIVLRGFFCLTAERDPFVSLAAAGLLVQLGLQAVIHMASALRLIPAKGMTLPFISYGGSSLLALALGMGMVLALLRRRPHEGGAK